MPVREMKPQRSTEHGELTNELAAEWSQPDPARVEPIIFIERSTDGKPAHVYVIWEKWSQIDRVERSEIVMEAADRSLPPGDVANISMAMGLTPEEATRLGMRF